MGAGFSLLVIVGMVVLTARPGTLISSDKPFAAAIARGKLNVAVPPRPAPVLTVGHVDRSIRSPDAFSSELAEDIGKRIGLPVELVLTEPSQAEAAVASGQADLAIDDLPFKPDSTLSFSPTPYTSGQGEGLVLRHGRVLDWKALRGGSICTSAGNAYGSTAATKYGATMQSYDRPLDALLAFQAGECTALVDDELVIQSLLKQADWSYYTVLDGRIDPARRFIATRHGNAASMSFVDDTVRGWRRSRWLEQVRERVAKQLAFDMFVAENDLYCH